MNDAGNDKKKNAWLFGRTSESLAVWMLRLKGYRIIARDHRTGAGEIDIIAKRGGMLAFVEVKARRDFNTAAEALAPHNAGASSARQKSFFQPGLNTARAIFASMSCWSPAWARPVIYPTHGYQAIEHRA